MSNKCIQFISRNFHLQKSSTIISIECDVQNPDNFNKTPNLEEFLQEHLKRISRRLKANLTFVHP
jgi:hypothetical protein